MATYGTVLRIGAVRPATRNWTKVPCRAAPAGPIPRAATPSGQFAAALRSPRQRGQGDEKSRAAAFTRDGSQAAAMRADNGLRDRQAQAQALRLGGVERLEQDFGRHGESRPTVDDVDVHAPFR